MDPAGPAGCVLWRDSLSTFPEKAEHKQVGSAEPLSPYLLGAPQSERRPEAWPGVPCPRKGGKLLRKTGFGMRAPLPRRPPAKKELFWIIQPCPATQEGRLQPGRGIHFRSPGLRESQKGGTGKSGQLYYPRSPLPLRPVGGGVGGDASPWGCSMPPQAVLS